MNALGKLASAANLTSIIILVIIIINGKFLPFPNYNLTRFHHLPVCCTETSKGKKEWPGGVEVTRKGTGGRDGTQRRYGNSLQPPLMGTA